jgi:hypothetical protein
VETALVACIKREVRSHTTTVRKFGERALGRGAGTVQSVQRQRSVSIRLNNDLSSSYLFFRPTKFLAIWASRDQNSMATCLKRMLRWVGFRAHAPSGMQSSR